MNYLVQTIIPTRYGDFLVKAYDSGVDQFPHLALFTKNYLENDVVDVRIHSECMTGDVFGSFKCDCGEQLDYSLKWIQQHGGVLIYLRQEGRGIGLVNKLMAYNLQNEGFNTSQANIELGFHTDHRSYDEVIQILEGLKVERIRLLTNNPEKIKVFDGSPIEMVSRIPIEVPPKPENIDYLHTKKHEMGHFLSL